MGKTALALKLAEKLTPSLQDAQIFVDLLGVSAQPPWQEADWLEVGFEEICRDARNCGDIQLRNLPEAHLWIATSRR